KALEAAAREANIDIQIVTGSCVRNHILVKQRYELQVTEESGLDVLHGHFLDDPHQEFDCFACDLTEAAVEDRALVNAFGKAYSSDITGDGPSSSQINSLSSKQLVPRQPTRPQQEFADHLSDKETRSDGELDIQSHLSLEDDDEELMTGQWDRSDPNRQYIKSDAYRQVSPRLTNLDPDVYHDEVHNFMTSSISIMEQLGKAEEQRAMGKKMSSYGDKHQLLLAAHRTILHRPLDVHRDGFDVASESYRETLMRTGRPGDRFINWSSSSSRMSTTHDTGTDGLAALIANDRDRRR
ncbi:hypothetical protein TrRE_jg12375, partial [Triparma retinervis]